MRKQRSQLENECCIADFCDFCRILFYTLLLLLPRNCYKGCVDNYHSYGIPAWLEFPSTHDINITEKRTGVRWFPNKTFFTGAGKKLIVLRDFWTSSPKKRIRTRMISSTLKTPPRNFFKERRCVFSNSCVISFWRYFSYSTRMLGTEIQEQLKLKKARAAAKTTMIIIF